ncbi:unnamed protein product, partial [Vitis vinifera]|uniref:Uncharacterized protein n=1 Tax=Vitis vinifera TaxID=29760 RepID=D7U517_VITVI
MGKTTLHTMTDIDLSIYACYHCFYSNAVNIIRNLKSYRSVLICILSMESYLCCYHSSGFSI